jgi:hypothetical protein
MMKQIHCAVVDACVPPEHIANAGQIHAGQNLAGACDNNDAHRIVCAGTLASISSWASLQ